MKYFLQKQAVAVDKAGGWGMKSESVNLLDSVGKTPTSQKDDHLQKIRTDADTICASS